MVVFQLVSKWPTLTRTFAPYCVMLFFHGNGKFNRGTGQPRAAVGTMAASGQQQQNVDLSVLSLEQLNQMKTQHEEEVQTLSGNFTKLRDAQVMQEGVFTFFLVI